MTDIPEDIMKAAREHVPAIEPAILREAFAEIAARAILAERERCARHTSALKFKSCTCPPPNRTDGQHDPECMTDRIVRSCAAIRKGDPSP